VRVFGQRKVRLFGKSASFLTASCSPFTFSPPPPLPPPQVSSRIIALAGKPAAEVKVLYLGTATYDLPGPRQRQTARFEEAGCAVSSLDLVSAAPTQSQLSAAVGGADVIIVSGGMRVHLSGRMLWCH